MRPGRVAAVLLAMLAGTALAGCAQEPADPNPLVGYCPHWVEGQAEMAGTVLRADGPSAEATIEPGNTSHNGLPFDMVRVHIVSGSGKASVRAEGDDGRHLFLRDRAPSDGGPATTDVLVYDVEEGQSFDVHLSSIAQEEDPRPGTVRLQWLGVGGDLDVSYHVHRYYRVCGAPADS